MDQIKIKERWTIYTLLCAAVGTASHWHGLDACALCTLYGCRHSMLSLWVTWMYCVCVCGTASIMFKNDKTLPNLPALN